MAGLDDLDLVPIQMPYYDTCDDCDKNGVDFTRASQHKAICGRCDIMYGMFHRALDVQRRAYERSNAKWVTDHADRLYSLTMQLHLRDREVKEKTHDLNDAIERRNKILAEYKRIYAKLRASKRVFDAGVI